MRMMRGGYPKKIPVTQEFQKKGEEVSSGDPQNQGISLCLASLLCFNLYFTMNMPVLHLACATP